MLRIIQEKRNPNISNRRLGNLSSRGFQARKGPIIRHVDNTTFFSVLALT